jgi:hypothetical protein
MEERTHWRAGRLLEKIETEKTDIVRTEEELIGPACGGEDGRLRPQRRHRATVAPAQPQQGANETTLKRSQVGRGGG